MNINRIALIGLGFFVAMSGIAFGDGAKDFLEKDSCGELALKEALKFNLSSRIQGMAKDELATGKYSFTRELKTIEFVRRSPLDKEADDVNSNEEAFELEYYVQLENDPAKSDLQQYQVLIAERTRPWHGDLKRRSCGFIDISWVEPKDSK